MKHVVIVVAGIGDEDWLMYLGTWHWRFAGLKTEMFRVGWFELETSFKQKLERICTRIDLWKRRGYMVSVVGVSAGGSMALNAFILRKSVIHRLVTVGSCVHNSGQYFLCDAFKESIVTFEKTESQLSAENKQRILTVRSEFGDKLVPDWTAIVEGAHNTTVPFAGHRRSIAMALTLWSKRIIDFIYIP